MLLLPVKIQVDISQIRTHFLKQPVVLEYSQRVVLCGRTVILAWNLLVGQGCNGLMYDRFINQNG
jgi:hypothetical protein